MAYEKSEDVIGQISKTETGSRIVMRSAVSVDDYNEFRDTITSTEDEFKKRIDVLEVELEKQRDRNNYLNASMENFIEASRHINVTVPYEDGSYLKAIGAVKTVTLFELIGANLHSFCHNGFHNIETN